GGSGPPQLIAEPLDGAPEKPHNACSFPGTDPVRRGRTPMCHLNCLRTTFAVAALALLAVLPAAGGGDAAKAEEVTIYRDHFGVPHIFAATEEGAAYGMVYAQRGDRLEELLKQSRRAEGTMAEAFGPEFVHHDYRQRVWQHRAVAEANYAKLPAKVRAITEAFHDGIRKYMAEHPA